MRGRVVLVTSAALAAIASSARADVRVAGAMGTVEVQDGGGAWQPATTGASLPVGARIAARDQATAQLAFGDDAGRLALRADAVVAIGDGAVRATVERGAVEQDLADAPAAVRLRTPAVQVEQKGGGAMVAVDAGGTTRIANLGGGTVKVRGVDRSGRPAGKTVVVAAGSGIEVAPGARPDKAQPLPVAPAWTTASATAVAVGGRGAALRAGFAPVAGITRYRVTVRTLGGDPVTALTTTSDSETGAVAIHRLRPGRYVARIAAVDAAGFESEPSAELPLEVVDLPVIAAGRDELIPTVDDTGDPSMPAPPPELDLGARLMVPAALTCQLGDDPPASWVVVTAAGGTTLHCSQNGADLPTPAVIGAGLDLALAGAPDELPRTGRTTLTFTMRDPAAAPAVDAIATGLRVHSVEAIATGVSVTVEPASAGGRLAELDLVLRDAPDVILTRVALAIAPPVEVVRDREPPPADDDGGVGLEVGAFAGYLAFPTDDAGGSELGNARDPDYRVASGPTVGARFALWPVSRVGVEAEAAITPTGYAAAAGRATIASYRAHLAISFVRDGRFGLRGAIGAGAQTLITGSGDAHGDTDSELHWGLGFTVGLSRGLQLRLDARHLIGPARDAGYASMFEIDLGVGARFGR